MRVIIVVLAVACVVAARGPKPKPNKDAFCDVTLSSEYIIESELEAFYRAIRYADSSFDGAYKWGTSSLAGIIPEKTKILTKSEQEIKAAVASFKTMVAPYLADPLVPNAATYITEMDKFVAKIYMLMQEGAVGVPYQEFIDYYTSEAITMHTGIREIANDTVLTVVGLIRDGLNDAVPCACKTLRGFVKLSLDLDSAGVDCGYSIISELDIHSAMVNRLLLSAKDSVLSVLKDGKSCLNTVAKKSNAQTKALLNVCLDVQADALEKYTEQLTDIYNYVFSYSRVKTELFKDKYETCGKTIVAEYFTGYFDFTNTYVVCTGQVSGGDSAVAAGSVGVSLNLFNAVSLNLLASLANIDLPVH